MSPDKNEAGIAVSQYLKPETALKWYSRMVAGALVYTLLVILFSLASLWVLLDQPYGGFLWSWDNTNGVHRASKLAIEFSGAIKPADFILAVAGEDVPSRFDYLLTRDIYGFATEVCADNPPEPPPMVEYTVDRRGEILNVQAPVSCFRWSTLLRLAVIPIVLALLMWVLAILIYASGRRRHLNLTFAYVVTLFAVIAAIGAANLPGVNKGFTIIGTFFINNYIHLISTAALFHLMTIFPPQHPSLLLYRLRWFWYGVAPIALMSLGTIRFRLAADHWHSGVGALDKFVAQTTLLYFFGTLMVLLIRYVWVYIVTPSKQIKSQLKWIIPGIVLTGFVCPFRQALIAPAALPWVPVNRPALLLWLLPPLIGIAFAIIRYQAFPHRTRILRWLMTLGAAIIAALLLSGIPLMEQEAGFVALLAALIGVNAFWVFPNPIQQTLQRFATPGTIAQKSLEQFNQAIQDIQDLDTLSAAIPQALENLLELEFVALWLRYDQAETLELAFYTDQAPADALPEQLVISEVWQPQPTRLTGGLLAEAGCDIMLSLSVGERKVGVLGLGKRWTGEIFDEADLKTLALVAKQAALTFNTARQIRVLRLFPLQVEQAQLEERKRIAQDLHDLTQAQLNQLSFALERVDWYLDRDQAQAKQVLEDCASSVHRASLDLRAILRNLLTDQMPGLSLLVAIHEYIEQSRTLYEDVTIQVQAAPKLEASLSPDKKLVLLRICRQAVDNALLHAQAKTIKITLQLDRQQNSVEFSIVDDGRGFIKRPMGDLVEGGHRGLYIMTSRAIEHRGHLEIDSTPGRGTIVKGYLPLQVIPSPIPML